MTVDQQTQLNRLDHLRFFAAFWVVLVHFPNGVPENLQNSQSIIIKIISLLHINSTLGVELFFVLSTFLFTILSDGGNRSIIYHKFIYNRMLRIFPLFFICVAMIFAITGSPTSEDYFGLLTFTMTYKFISTLDLGTIWSIGTEFKMYFILPLLLLFLKKKGITMFFLWILVLIIIKFLMVKYNPNIFDKLYISLIGRFDQFLIGIILGKLYLDGFFAFLKNKILANIVLIALISLLTGYLYLMHKVGGGGHDYTPFRLTVQAVIMAMIMVTYMYSTIFSYKIINNILRYLGGLSFSIYLFHALIGKIALKYYSFTGTFSRIQS